MDLREFEAFPAHALIKADPAKFDIEFEGISKVGDVTHKLDIQKSGEEYYCQGKVAAVVELECCRCLGKFDQPVEGATDFIICSSADHETDDDIVDGEDYAYFIGSDILADITDVTRQAIILSISLKPICQDDCLGICQTCGKNMNQESCNCKQEKIDPRWEALKKFSGATTENKE